MCLKELRNGENLADSMLRQIDRPKNFAIDYDNTLNREGFYKEDSVNLHSLNKKLVEFMREIKSRGHMITIWTCRDDFYLEKMIEVLEENDVPYDYINEFPDFETGSPKIVADYYIDDRAINIESLMKALEDRE